MSSQFHTSLFLLLLFSSVFCCYLRLFPGVTAVFHPRFSIFFLDVLGMLHSCCIIVSAGGGPDGNEA